MAPPRVDPYTSIHKALRSMLFEVSRLAGTTDFLDESATREAIAAIRSRLSLVKEHGQHEDAVIGPALEVASPHLAAGIVADHHQQEELLARIEPTLAGIEAVQGPARIGAALEAYRLVNDFIGAYLAHLNHEEVVILPVLWGRYSDDEIAGLRAKIQSLIPPPRFAEWMRHWIPALSPFELGMMLAGMRASAPPEVFDRVVGLARSVLGDAVWDVVRARGDLG
jgi:hypothetical protein